MTLFQLFILAIVQGITEFLPISSSGHLALIPFITGWADQGLMMDVSVHIGTLSAVLLYFWRDTKGLALAAGGAFGIMPARRAVQGTIYAKLFWALVIGTIPLVIVGGIMVVTGATDYLRSPLVIGCTSIVFGLLLYAADSRSPTTKTLDRMAIKPALIIGAAQTIALIPGSSRAGMTMTAARFLGFNREESARFSMLMSIPAIVASGAAVMVEAVQSATAEMWMDAGIGAVFSCIAALISIYFLMRWLAHASMTIFVVYRVALGAVLIGLIGAGVL